MTEIAQTVFLIDIDNTLLDNDQVVLDLKQNLSELFSKESQDRYWSIFEKLRSEQGYADYLGAIQRYRIEDPRDTRFQLISTFLLEYPFRNRLYPGALELLEKLNEWGTPVILSDGDAVFQPHKAHCSGIYSAVEGRVLIYIHKEQELDDVAQRFPAEHYVLIDDKPRLLHAIKKAWGNKLTTVFPVQGHYAHDMQEVNKYPAPDITVQKIGDLLKYDIADIIQSAS